MKKNFLLISNLLPILFFSQIGINTSSPATTLDIVSSPADLSKKDGVTVPRLTRQQLTNKGDALYTANERSTMIYITDISGGNTTSQRINMNAVGYYYFDGSVCQKMSPDISTPMPAYFRVTADIPSFLISQSIGQSTRVFNLLQIKNAIPGLIYDPNSSNITFPPGTYQITFVYEAIHNATGCTISSYYLDFPEGTTATTRVHSTASHIEGATSNHGGNIIYTTTVTGNRNWQVNLGRGQSGNCTGSGMTLKAQSTHLLIFKIGD
ncbi:hypothetical protein [Chryseobacterium indologenes]|uniref:hypothetical protein n=1 Tax=Chryseobacterium indologenes TaxID=253 RepID=UPI0009A142AC|nr:hypothetical protein [Chryseobacterium indologenes]